MFFFARQSDSGMPDVYNHIVDVAMNIRWTNSLEVNHHIKNGGSFWIMISPYYKKVLVRKPTYKKWWPRTSRVLPNGRWKNTGRTSSADLGLAHRLLKTRGFRKYLVGGFIHMFNFFPPNLGGNHHPIWRMRIFLQMGWFNSTTN